MVPEVTKGVARVDPKCEDGNGRMESSLMCLTGVTSSTWAQREACTRFEQSDVARPQNELTPRS